MAREGRPPKQADQRQGNSERAKLVALVPKQAPPPEPEIPKPPDGLLVVTKKAWATFWTSEVAPFLIDVDLFAVSRLFTMYDQWERSMRLVRKAPAVKGSTGQMKVNPFGEQALKLNAHILKLENELGLTPLSRARLGIATGQAELTVAEVNKMAKEQGGDGEDTIDGEADEVFAEWESA